MPNHHTPNQLQPTPIQQLQTTALTLLAAGISVIPLHNKEPFDPYKRPYHDSKTGEFVEYPRLSWKPYTTKQPTRQQVEHWFSPHLTAHNQPNGIGYCTGQVSGNIQVLDFESEQRYERWCSEVGPLTTTLPTIRTGRGYNVVWTCPTPYTAKDHDPGQVEARGDQLYSIAPPSWHPKAQRTYSYVHGDLLALPHLDQATSDRLIAAAAAKDKQLVPPHHAPAPAPRPIPTTTQIVSGEELRALYNTRFELEAELRHYGGRPASAGRWHCPAHQDHEHHDQDGSFDISPSKHPEKYGQLIGGCWQPTCRLFGTKGRIISSFDLMQVMDGLTRSQAHQHAAERLSIAHQQHTVIASTTAQEAPGVTDDQNDDPDDRSTPNDDPDCPPANYDPEAPSTAQPSSDRSYPTVFWGVSVALMDFLTEMRTAHKCMPATLFYAQAIRSMGREGTILEMQATIRIHHCSYSDRHVKNARRQFHQLTQAYHQATDQGEIISPPLAHIEEVNLIQAETTPSNESLGCDFVWSVPQVAPDPSTLSMQLGQEQAALEEARSAGGDRQFVQERVSPPQRAPGPKRRSRPLNTLSIVEDVPELKRRRYAAQRAAQRAHDQGNIAQARAITRSIRIYREQIERLEHEYAARQVQDQASPPPTLFDLANVPAPAPAPPLETLVVGSYAAATRTIPKQNHTSIPVRTPQRAACIDTDGARSCSNEPAGDGYSVRLGSRPSRNGVKKCENEPYSDAF
jgi:hypothetical protein